MGKIMEANLMSEEDRLGPKGNNPPSDLELLNDYLAGRTEALRGRYTDLLEAIERAPAECNDDDMAGKFGDMIKQLTACIKALETQRVDEKEPYLTLGRGVDGFFKKFTENLDSAKRKISRPLEIYLKRKEDERRQAALAEAARQRDESARLAREAAELEQANMTQAANETLNEAVRVDEQAQKSEKLAEAKPAELARTRGDYGSVATLRTTWVGEILDRSALDKTQLWAYIPTDALQKALNAFVRAGGRELHGAKIYEQSTAQVK
jgi:hypothetical protein